MSQNYTYRFRIKYSEPGKKITRKEMEITAPSHRIACDRLDRSMIATYWFPDAFLGSDDPAAPKRKE